MCIKLLDQEMSSHGFTVSEVSVRSWQSQNGDSTVEEPLWKETAYFLVARKWSERRSQGAECTLAHPQ